MRPFLSVLSIIIMLAYGCNSNDGTGKIQDPQKEIEGTSLVLVPSNGRPAELLCQHWQDSADLADGVLRNSNDDGLDIPFHDLCFFKDGIVVQNVRNDMKTGKWSYDGWTRHVKIVFNDASRSDYSVREVTVKKLLLMPADGRPEIFTSDGKQQRDLKDDPFYPANTQWRIRPSHPESDSGIKTRVIACVLFYNKFFKDNADRKLPAISFYGLPGCFKWYGGGISIINKDKLGQRWIDCFYSKEDALKGQQLLENNITKKYNWNKKERNWIRQSQEVLLQMADSIKHSVSITAHRS